VGEPQEPLTIKTYERIQRRGVQRNLKTDRINFIDYWAYMGALATARVVLDTHPYGGCLTALDALSNGVPLVVLPGPAERGRHAASIYQQMGVSDFVAANQSDYVDIAVRLGTDDAYHEEAVKRIRASYLDAHRAGAVAGEWAGAFLRMARGAI
jgi:predicted O-linked N-acetylglucosamine transferase (SPINDLY family)